MNEESIPFGAWLKRQRRARDLTQEELAGQIGCAPVTLHKIETGERRPSKPILERLAGILEIPPDEQPAFMAYARAVYPGEAGPPPVSAPKAPIPSPWQASVHDQPKHNLPVQLTSFIGREREIAEVGRLLGETRLLTLTGAGGAGKTRLALQAAAGLLADYPNGVWWVELASLYDPALVPQAIGAALGLRDDVGRPMLDQLGDHLRPRRLLLVLDNCEHLIAACAACADTLLRAAPDLKILVTSREPLGIAGETTYRVPSLETPDPEHLPPLGVLVRCEAVRLFAERGAAVLPGFAVTDASGAAVAEICARLDGIPLAIELAAARIRGLPVEELRARLDDRFRVLTGGSRLALPRHRTLRATIDWSYGLLTEAERALLRRLAVFAGGWTLEAAEAVCSGDGVLEDEVLDLLARLVDKSLVILEFPGDHGRYRMLETVRQYGVELLEKGSEAFAWRQRHAGFFLALAEEAEPKLYGPEQDAWLARLEDEHGNLRAALEWLAAQGKSAKGLRLAGALWRFWEVRGHWVDARAWLAEMLRLAGPGADPAARAKALMGAAGCAYLARDNAASELWEESLSLYRSLGDWQGTARVLLQHGRMIGDRGDFARAQDLLEASAAICKKIGDQQGLGLALITLGFVAYWAGDAAGARPLLERGLALGREVHDRLGVAIGLEIWSWTLTDLGEFGLAQAAAEEAISLCRELGDRRYLAGGLGSLAAAKFYQGSMDEAYSLWRQAQAMEWELRDKLGVAFTTQGVIVCSLAQGRPARALRLGSAIGALVEAAGFVLPTSWRIRLEQLMAAAHQTLSADEADTAYIQGRFMSWEQMIAEAQGE